MKTKIWTLSMASLLSFSLFAQTPTTSASLSSTTFGVRAGVNFQNINGKDASGNNLDYGISTGFHMGANAEIPVGTGSYFQPGILYSLKGAKLDKSADTKLKISYIEVPLNYVYKPTLGTGQLILGFGPYVGFGIGGKVRNDNTKNDIEFKSTISAANPSRPYTYKRFDAGANALAGYQFANGISLQLNTQLGLVNINPEFEGNIPNDKSKAKNTGFGLSLGYRF